MADIALRGAAVVPTGNPTTGWTVVIPSQVVAGDLLYLLVASRDSVGAGTLAVTDNDAAGANPWTKIGNSTDHKLTLWRKRATSATASKTITVANAVGSSAGVLKCFSGGTLGATMEADIVVESNASGNETHAGFTPSCGSGMICAGVVNYANDNAVTSLSFATLGATTATEKLSTGGSDCGAIFGHALQTGAVAGTGNLTWAQTDGTTYSITWTIIPECEGTLSVTLAAATVTGTGEVDVNGTLSATLDAATVDGDGTVSVSAQLSSTLDAATVDGDASVAVVAQLSSTLDDATLDADGTVETSGVSGTLDVTLDAATVDGDGTVSVSAAATPTLDDATLAATAKVDVTAQLASTLDAATSAGAGDVDVASTLNASLDDASLAATGTVAVSAALDHTLAAATLSATTAVDVAASLAASLADATLDGAGIVGEPPVEGVLNQTLADCVLAASAQVSLSAQCVQTLEPCTASAFAQVSVSAQLSVTLAEASVQATASVAVTGTLGSVLASVTLEGEGVVGDFFGRTGTLDVTLEDVTLTAAGVLSALVRVRFKRPYAPTSATSESSIRRGRYKVRRGYPTSPTLYGSQEVASFPPAEAADLVALGIADYY